MKKSKFLSNADIIALFGTLLTFGALVFSICQNATSNKRYEKNEIDNNNELKRIRLRDSVQTSVLINELKEQQNRNVKDRQNDSSQLSLFNRQIKLLNKSILAQNHGIDIQNQNLEVSKLANRSDLQCTISFDLRHTSDTSMVISPMFSIENVGNSIARDGSFKYMIVVVHNWAGFTDCVKGLDGHTMDFSNYLAPGKTSKLKMLDAHSLPYYSPSVQQRIYKRATSQFIRNSYIHPFKNDVNMTIAKSKIDSMDNLYNQPPFAYYIISQIEYHDKYQKEKNTLYSIGRISPQIILQPSVKDIKFVNVNINQAVSLKKCILNYRMDYKKVFDVIKLQSFDTTIEK